MADWHSRAWAAATEGLEDVARGLRLGGRIEAGKEPVRNVNEPLYMYEIQTFSGEDDVRILRVLFDKTVLES